MKKESIIIFIVFTLLFLVSCEEEKVVPKEIISEIEQKRIDDWMKDYKIVTFQRCLFLGYDRNDQIRNLFKLDRSSHQNFAYGLNEYQYIDSLVQPIILRAKADSIQYFNNRLKGINEIEQAELNGLPLIKYCLEFYATERLDSIANSRVKEMKLLWKK